MNQLTKIVAIFMIWILSSCAQTLETPKTLPTLHPSDADHSFQGIITATSAQGIDDLDCRDFVSQAEAIEYFRLSGGSTTNNVASLDWNHNGIPCEVYEYWTIVSARWNPPVSTPAPPVTTPAPTPPVTTPTPTPPVTTPNPPSNSGMCWVKPYYRHDGTYVRGYWRKC